MKPKIIVTAIGLLAILVGSAMGQSPEHEYLGLKDELHVYLLIGQSNMAGRATYGDGESGPIEGGYLLNGLDEWEAARVPLNRYSTIRKGLEMQRLNPGYAFAQAMLESSDGASIGLVVNAKGGTKIEQWEKGTEFYAEAVRRTKAAAVTGTLKGILWHQGEGNSREPEAYPEKLAKLIEDLRQDLGAPHLPFIAGQVHYHTENKPHTKRLNELLAQFPESVPYTACVKSESLATFDHTHFGTEAMIELGRRYAASIRLVQRRLPVD